MHCFKFSDQENGLALSTLAFFVRFFFPFLSKANQVDLTHMWICSNEQQMLLENMIMTVKPDFTKTFWRKETKMLL